MWSRWWAGQSSYISSWPRRSNDPQPGILRGAAARDCWASGTPPPLSRVCSTPSGLWTFRRPYSDGEGCVCVLVVVWRTAPMGDGVVSPARTSNGKVTVPAALSGEGTAAALHDCVKATNGERGGVDVVALRAWPGGGAAWLQGRMYCTYTYVCTYIQYFGPTLHRYFLVGDRLSKSHASLRSPSHSRCPLFSRPPSLHLP